MSQFKTILNFRDVGETVNKFLGKKWIKPNLFYRSARPDESSLADRTLLRDKVQISSIVDLRTTTEHDQQEAKRKQRLKDLANSLPPESNSPPPLQIEGIRYELINFNGHAYSWHLINQLTWSQFFSLLYLMAVGRRLEAISILGTNVMKPRGLSGLAVDSIDVCKAEVRAVFMLLLERVQYPLLIHCTQGKDRTGLIAILVLMLLGTDVKAIQQDYMISKDELYPEREAKLKEVHSIGLPDEFADCDPHLVQTVVDHILDKFLSVEAYLEACGVTWEMQQRVKTILCGEDHPGVTKQ